MRMLKILAGVMALVMLTSCTAIDKVTSFVISIAEDAAPIINIDSEMSVFFFRQSFSKRRQPVQPATACC